MEIYSSVPSSVYEVCLVSKTLINSTTNELIEPDENGLYNLVIGSTKFKRDINWLILFSILKPELPMEFNDRYDNIEFVKHKPVFKRRFYVPYTIVFKEPLHVELNGEEYRLVPRYPKVAISKYGRLYNFISGSFPKCSYGGNRDYLYYIVRDTMIDNKRLTIGMHRLVAMAWIPNDDWHNKNIVDHIDGDKYNNSVNNLQWVSASENVKRALIMKSSECVFCRRVDGHNIHSFSSLNKCCEYMGRSFINPIITPLTPGRVWSGKNGKFYVSYTPEELIPRYEEDPNKIITSVRAHPVEVYNIHTHERLSFSSATACARELGLGITAVMNRLYNKSLRNVPLGSWLVRVLSKEKWLVNDIDDKNNSPKQCFVKNLSTGGVISFESIKALGRFLKTTNHVINKHIKNKKPFMRNGVGFIIVNSPVS